MRIYVTGAQSTGKSTLAKYIASSYKLPRVHEVVRGILAKHERSLESLAGDLPAVEQIQREIAAEQIGQEKKHPEGFVSDRCFDFMAYIARSTRLTSEFSSNDLAWGLAFSSYLQTLRLPDALIFFVRPHKILLTADGFRSKNDLRWDEVVRIDAMIEFMLELYGLRYFTIASHSMRDRVRLVDAIIGLAIQGEKNVERK